MKWVEFTLALTGQKTLIAVANITRIEATAAKHPETTVIVQGMARTAVVGTYAETIQRLGWEAT